MNNKNSLFVKPLDVLYLRGNRLFDSGGDHGEAQMPPWPSMMAGALRSRIMEDAQADFQACKNGQIKDALKSVIGTPEKPGDFQLHEFTIARLHKQEAQRCYPLPADCYVAEAATQAQYLHPVELPDGISASCRLNRVAALKTLEKSKPANAQWLTQTGFNRYLNGEPLQHGDFLSSSDLWTTDQRLGIALDRQSHSAEESKIYTTDVIDFNADCGFVCSFSGARALCPQTGLLRLGGDGHAASLLPIKPVELTVDLERIAHEKRFRLIMLTPGLFEKGWLPAAVDEKNFRLESDHFSARLSAVALSRPAIISGWDMVKNLPKTAYKTVAVGSVYWFEDFSGDIDELQQLSNQGFWLLSDYPDANRKAEGFNQCIIAPWAKH